MLLAALMTVLPLRVADQGTVRLQPYCQALRLYADGRIEAAVAMVDGWSAAELRTVMQQTTRCTGVGATPPYAVLLATDVAVARRGGTVEQVADYLGAAAGPLASVQPAHLGSVERAAVLAFQEDWFVVASRLLLAWTDPVAASKVIGRGLAAFKDSSRLRTLSGMAAEMRAHLANPNLHDAPMIDTMARNPLRALLIEAENAFRRALVSDSRNAEARVHLGRVLFVRKELADARAAFALVIDDSNQPLRWRYLAQLFAGAVDQFEHDWAAAGRHYEAARQLIPEQQTPYIALSFVERAAGHEQRARDAIAAWADAPEPVTEDPWSAYQNGGFDEDALEALRGRVKP